jgi:hypothetical protein
MRRHRTIVTLASTSRHFHILLETETKADTETSCSEIVVFNSKSLKSKCVVPQHQ